MKIIICGAGKVGATIAEYLALENNDITIIDSSVEALSKAEQGLDIQTIHGKASQPDVLEAAGAKNAEMIIAATSSDETNMMACQVAYTLFNVPKKIARIRDKSYMSPTWANLFNRDHLPVDAIILPEQEIATSIINRLKIPGTFNIFPVAEGLAKVVGVICSENCTLNNKTIEEFLEANKSIAIQPLARIRDNEKKIVDYSYTPEAGDEFYFITPTDVLQSTMKLFNKTTPKIRYIIIMGGGNVGVELALRIEKELPGSSVKIIENSPERAKELSQLFDDMTIICGDALEKSVMEEAQIQNCEALIAVSNNDEANILASLLAKRMGCERAITLATRSHYPSFLSSLGIDAVVNPRAITVSSIMRHVRRGPIHLDYSLRDGFAEILEMEPDSSARIINTPISDLDLPETIKIAGIKRDKDFILPTPETEIKTGDHVILFVAHDDIKKVERLFSQRADYY